jgi:hypothetical protein
MGMKLTLGLALFGRFQTFSHEAFNPLAELFLSVQGKKMVKDGLIRDHLTPRGLAYWFCDDGGKLDYTSPFIYSTMRAKLPSPRSAKKDS